jgi:hypothetical protein
VVQSPLLPDLYGHVAVFDGLMTPVLMKRKSAALMFPPLRFTVVRGYLVKIRHCA